MDTFVTFTLMANTGYWTSRFSGWREPAKTWAGALRTGGLWAVLAVGFSWLVIGLAEWTH